ncbi:MAG TPA: DUF3854 domain-containing protein, partial [Gemmataceae bacterium]|nr:DUF3854 domain-containing protein [Gemmataceae bacterium]
MFSLTNGTTLTRRLTAAHLSDLRSSGLTDGTIMEAHIYSEPDPSRVAALLNWERPAWRLGSCLVIPYFDAGGTPTGYSRLKPARPRNNGVNSKPAKYEAPRGIPNRLYIPPSVAELLADETSPLIITEGEKKALAATQHGFPAVSIAGVWSWQKKRAKVDGKATGPREMIDDLACMPLRGREIRLVFDSDVTDNVNVRWAEWYLAAALQDRGAKVTIVRLPPGEATPDGKRTKIGLDDFLVAHGREALLNLLAHALPPAKPAPDDDRPTIMLTTDEHLVIDSTIKALADRDPGLFQRGGELVTVNDDPPLIPRLQPSGSPRIIRVPPANLRTRIARSTRLIQRTGSGDAAVSRRVHPPRWLYEGMSAESGWAGIRPLAAVVETPILRPDGTVQQQPGYDDATGVVYRPSIEFPSIPESPTLT